MAPVDDDAPPGELAKYLEKGLQDTIAKYDKLWEVEDPEETPYKSKYEARALLEAALKKVEQLVPEATDNAEAERGREVIARLHLYLGKNFYFCEEVPVAEQHLNRALERYLRSPQRLQPDVFVHIQDVLNQLGMLWCNRQSHSEGMNFLRRAQIMFLNRPQAVREAEGNRSEDNYTLTMFYLAQAYGGLRKPALSARFCAETLSRQLEHNSPGHRSKDANERDPFDCKDWVRNCCALSDFFANEAMFWSAEYLLHSAALLAERCDELCGIRPEGLPELRAEIARDTGNLYSTRLKFARTCAEHPGLGEQVWHGERRPAAAPQTPSEGSRLSFRCAADQDQPPPQAEPIAWDEIFPEVVHLEDEEAQDNRLAEETEAASGGEGTGWLELGTGERVRLPVHFVLLHARVEVRIQRANTVFRRLRGEPELVEVAEEDATVARKQPSCIGTSFGAVREIFKLANRYLGKALCYFQLDGWVTEHVRILQELSQMYKTLQFWERDAKRAAAMLKRRTRMLAPLLEVLNPKVYVAFWKQLSFEVAEIYQELYELKARGKLPGTPLTLADEDDDEVSGHEDVKRAARCNELSRKAVAFYSTFIDSYHPDGKVPEQIDDDNVRAYLTARMNRARVRTKVRGLRLDEQLEQHRLALREYEWILDYGRRHPEVSNKPEIGMATELRLCEEMVSMLPSQLSRLAAKRRG